MDNEGGEDLTWFWREWFYNNWQLDISVQSVSYKNDDVKNGADITIANLQKMVMPATIEISFQDGTKQEIELPVETWMQSGVHTFHLQTTKELQSIVIDPKGLLPDSNRSNNVWRK